MEPARGAPPLRVCCVGGLIALVRRWIVLRGIYGRQTGFRRSAATAFHFAAAGRARWQAITRPRLAVHPDDLHGQNGG